MKRFTAAICTQAHNSGFMLITHKNKTLATLLAAVLGGAGIHRFYLRGLIDPWGWLHAAGLVVTAASLLIWPPIDPVHWFLLRLPLIVSILAGALEALVLGLTSDEKWDAHYNAASGKRSSSKWPLALIIVLTLAIGMGGLIFTIVRGIDLFLTSGSYG
jgi:TM2 domain-containing membrane protein YozV